MISVIPSTHKKSNWISKVFFLESVILFRFSKLEKSQYISMIPENARYFLKEDNNYVKNFKPIFNKFNYNLH